MSKFNDLSPEGKEAFRREFDNPTTPHERRIALLELLREGANESKLGNRCPRCKNYPFFAPYIEGLIEGHVYTHDGIMELRISRYCEFCFDLITKEPDEDEDDESWKQAAIASDIAEMARAMGPGTEVRVLTDDEVRGIFDDTDETKF